MFKSIVKFFKRSDRKKTSNSNSKDAAKERLHLVLMQDRANVSADFLDLMRQEIIEVIKKYIDIDESSMDVRLTNQANEDGTQGAPALYANIPIINIKNEMKNVSKETKAKEDTKEEISKEDEETKKIKEEAMKIVEEEKKQEDIETTNVHNEKEKEQKKEETLEKEKINKKEKKDE